MSDTSATTASDSGGSTLVGPWQLLVVLVVTAASLVWVLWGLELEGVKNALTRVKWLRVLAALGVLFVNHLLRVWRFQVLVNNDLSYGRALAVCSVGYMAVNTLPLRLGELVRPYLLTYDDVPVGRSGAAVVVERLLDLLMMLILMGITVSLQLPSAIEVRGVDVVDTGQKVVGGALAVAVVGLGLLVAFGERLSGHLPDQAGAFVGSLSVALGELARSPGRAALLLLQSLLVWGSTIVYVFVMLTAFPDLPARFDAAVVTWTAIVAGILVLPTPGFLGAYEAFGLAALMLWEIDEQSARTFTLVLHLGVFGLMAVLGSAFMAREGWSLVQVVRESRSLTGAIQHLGDDDAEDEVETRGGA